MATNRLNQDEGIFYFLREKYGSVDAALASSDSAALSGIGGESALREALEGPQHDQIIAILIGLAAEPRGAGAGQGLRNQDIEVENDETHLVGTALPDDGPSTLFGAHALAGDWDGDGHDLPHRLVGDWNGDGRDTVGIGDFTADADVDAADYVV